MILITGATGLAGSHVLYECLRNSAVPIIAQYRNRVPQALMEALLARLDAEHGTKTLEMLPARVTWVQADLLDEVRLTELYGLGPTEVFHTAAMVHVGKAGGSYMLGCNIRGTAMMVDLALQFGVKRFIHFSSVASLPRKEHEPIHEAMSEQPEFPNVYAESKYRSEMEVWRAHAEGLPVTIVNPAVILGFGDYRRSSLKVVEQVARGLKFYPKGGNAIVDARDVAYAAWHLSRDENTIGERYMLAAATVPFKDMLQLIARTLGVREPSILLHPRWNGLFVFAMGIRAMLQGEKNFITRQLADITSKYFYYDTSKITSALPGFQFRDPMQTISESAEGFKEWLKVRV